MSIFAVFKLAFLSIARNKMRSFLTALGIIIGVSSVITMVGLGQGAYYSVQNEISKMGTNLLIIVPGSSQRRGMSMGMGSMDNLTEDDARAVLQQCPAIALVAPLVRAGGQVVFAGRNWSTSVMGTTAMFPEVRSWEVSNGRFFSERETRSGAKVCVIGKTVAENLFGSLDPVGRTIRFRQLPLEVVGVLESKGLSGGGMGADQDDVIIAPLPTIQRRILGINHIHMFFASAQSEDLIPQAKEEISQVIRRRHRLAEKDDDGFSIRTQSDIAEAAGSTLAIIGLLLGSVASVSLVVGGIGIMNIMLVSVTERTREIGIRMAIGAKSRDILTQFLVEAVALSCAGGSIGILFGAALVHLITSFTQWPAMVSTAAITGSFLFSAFVGIFFGMYPAWKASNLDPIEALRFE